MFLLSLTITGYNLSMLFFVSLTAEAQGLPCEFSRQVYQHGEDFQPSCRHQCTCMDGVVGCMPLCPQQMPLPDRHCSRPRLARPGQDGCCEEWVCDDDNRISEETKELSINSLQEVQPLPNHISTLQQAQLQPHSPAATRGATLRGKATLCIPTMLFIQEEM